MARVLVVDDDADVLHPVWTQMRVRGHLVLGRHRHRRPWPLLSHLSG